MDPIPSTTAALRMQELLPDNNSAIAAASSPSPEKSGEVSRQFEAILVRQFLGESLKPMLEGGPSGQVYGYLLTDSLAQTLCQGQGLGLSHILQTQLIK